MRRVHVCGAENRQQERHNEAPEIGCRVSVMGSPAVLDLHEQARVFVRGP